MTVEEKREILKAYCISRDMDECTICPLYQMLMKDGACYSDLDDKKIERNYEILFGKESEEQNVPAEPKITLRDLIDIVEVPIIVSETYFNEPIITLDNLDEYSLDEYKHILSPEFLDREVDRMKTRDNYILVALKEVEI